MTRILLRLAGWLPLPVLHFIGWLGGSLMWYFPNSQRRIALQQIQWCLPDWSASAQKKLAKRSLVETAKAVVEAPAFWYGPAFRLNRWLDDKALLAQMKERRAQADKPIIFLTPHLGAWELSSFFGAQLGPLTVLYKPQTRSEGAANRLMNEGRTRVENIKLASTDSNGVRLLMNALKRREMIGILPDHDPPEGSGVYAPLFGHPAHTMDLVSKLARKSGAPVVFFIAERLPWARGFRFHCVEASEGIDDDELGATVMNKDLEKLIMQRPEQYWWGYKRFRRLPADVQSPYHR